MAGFVKGHDELMDPRGEPWKEKEKQSLFTFVFDFKTKTNTFKYFKKDEKLY